MCAHIALTLQLQDLQCKMGVCNYKFCLNEIETKISWTVWNHNQRFVYFDASFIICELYHCIVMWSWMYWEMKSVHSWIIASNSGQFQPPDDTDMPSIKLLYKLLEGVSGTWIGPDNCTVVVINEMLLYQYVCCITFCFHLFVHHNLILG